MSMKTLQVTAGTPSRWGTPPIVVAMAVIAIAVFIVLQYRHSQALIFQKIEVVSNEYRGPEGGIKPPVFTEQQLQQFAILLQEQLGTTYAELAPPAERGWFKSQTDWLVGSSVQELFDGSLAVRVKAFVPKEETLLKEWSREFEAGEDVSRRRLRRSARISAKSWPPSDRRQPTDKTVSSHQGIKPTGTYHVQQTCQADRARHKHGRCNGPRHLLYGREHSPRR